MITRAKEFARFVTTTFKFFCHNLYCHNLYVSLCVYTNIGAHKFFYNACFLDNTALADTVSSSPEFPAGVLRIGSRRTRIAIQD